MEIVLIFAGSIIFLLLGLLVALGNEGGKMLSGLSRTDLGRPSRLDAVFLSMSIFLFVLGLIKIFMHLSISLH